MSHNVMVTQSNIRTYAQTRRPSSHHSIRPAGGPSESNQAAYMGAKGSARYKWFAGLPACCRGAAAVQNSSRLQRVSSESSESAPSWPFTAAKACDVHQAKCLNRLSKPRCSCKHQGKSSQTMCATMLDGLCGMQQVAGVASSLDTDITIWIHGIPATKQ
jgi:hypothetical protein